MPAGDAGPERQTWGECAFDPDHLYHDHHEAEALRAEIDRLQAQLTAQQAVVEAARWIEEDGWTPATRAALMDALTHLPSENAQAAQPEGESR